MEMDFYMGVQRHAATPLAALHPALSAERTSLATCQDQQRPIKFEALIYIEFIKLADRCAKGCAATQR
jgi:hypothetical protein